MKFRPVFLWRCAIVVLGLLSLLAILRAGFQPCCFGSASAERSYPWVAVALMSIVTTMECLILYLIWQPPKSNWSPVQLGGALGLFLILSIPAVNILLTTDLPTYLYVTSEFTLLLTLILLLLLAITVISSLGKRLFSRWRMAGNK